MIRLALFLTLALAAVAAGQTIVLKDGKKVMVKGLRRSGDAIMAANPAVDGAAVVQGEVGYPLGQIERIEFPEPAVLKSTAGLLASGKAAEALSQSEPALAYFANFRDAPGSYWPDLALLRLGALAALNRDAEAEPLAREIVGQANNPHTIRGAQVQLAGIAGRRGEHAKAIEICDQILKEGSKPETMAAAAINKSAGPPGVEAMGFRGARLSKYPGFLSRAEGACADLSSRLRSMLFRIVRSLASQGCAQRIAQKLSCGARGQHCEGRTRQDRPPREGARNRTIDLT